MGVVVVLESALPVFAPLFELTLVKFDAQNVTSSSSLLLAGGSS